MNLNKLWAVLVGSVLLIGAGCSGAPMATENTPTETATPSTTKQTTSAPVATPSATATKKTTNSTIKPSATKKYTDAVNSYGFQGARIQFGNCSGNPSSLSLKVGVKFMIDNRDGVTRIFGIGKAKYYVEPYGFAIVSVPTAGNYIMTCNGGGAAQLIVQN